MEDRRAAEVDADGSTTGTVEKPTARSRGIARSRGVNIMVLIIMVLSSVCGVEAFVA